MKIRELLCEESAQTVLTKMATTINPAVSQLNGYTSRSCFGKVAHYLKTHRDPSWYILLFGIRSANEVTHCCLYDDVGNRIVDTFDGEPKNVGGNIVYVDKDRNEHELLTSLSVGQFEQRYFGQ